MTFPDGFWWGTAASSTQAEGAAPRSDWWAWEQAGRAPRSGEGNGFGAPELLLEGAEIYDYAVEDSALGATSSARVFVLVADETLPALLDALSNEARIAVVVNAGAQ